MNGESFAELADADHAEVERVIVGSFQPLATLGSRLSRVNSEGSFVSIGNPRQTELTSAEIRPIHPPRSNIERGQTGGIW
jgi:hypothetical protein